MKTPQKPDPEVFREAAVWIMKGKSLFVCNALEGVAGSEKSVEQKFFDKYFKPSRHAIVYWTDDFSVWNQKGGVRSVVCPPPVRRNGRKREMI